MSGTLDPSMGVTTIGFGTSSSSSSSSSAPANFFGAASAAAFAAPTGANFFGNAASSCANPTNQFFQFPNAFGSSSAPATSSVGASAGGSTLQVKRKVKPVAALDVTEPLSNTQVQGVVDSTATNGISEKKQKVAEEI